MLKNIFRILLPIIACSYLPYAYAITFPNCDSSTGADCGHENVAFFSIFDTTTGITVAGTRCSGVVIEKDANKVVYLTAAHCAKEWLTLLSNDPVAYTLGVSMDPVIAHLATNQNLFDWTQFLTGAIPVMYSNAGQGNSSTLGGNPYNVEDYAAVVVPFNSKFPSSWIPKLKPQLLIQDVNQNMGAIVASYKFPNKDLHFSAAGYGLMQLVDFPGKLNGGGAGADRSTLGSLRVSELQTFRNLHELTIFTSQNPAQGFNGACGGDSGGPNYYKLPDGREIQVGITSAGDAACRSTNTISRIDTQIAIDFINCVRNPNKLIKDVKACGLSN